MLLSFSCTSFHKSFSLFIFTRLSDYPVAVPFYNKEIHIIICLPSFNKFLYTRNKFYLESSCHFCYPIYLGGSHASYTSVYYFFIFNYVTFSFTAFTIFIPFICFHFLVSLSLLKVLYVHVQTQFHLF